MVKKLLIGLPCAFSVSLTYLGVQSRNALLTCKLKSLDFTFKLPVAACFHAMSALDSAVDKPVPAKKRHEKCTSGTYPKSKIKRVTVPDEKAEWNVKWPDYDPPDYDADKLKGATYADKPADDPSFHPKFNEKEGNLDRRSWHGKYAIVNNRPQNYVGRTGLRGRGNLGRWGPNHAGDAVVTRWKLKDEKNNDGERVVNSKTGKPILQLLLVQRVYGSEWAFPGGMVDAGENHADAIKREFLEEACTWEDLPMEEKTKAERIVDKLMGKACNEGQEIYRGYVDDPRNTDNAWMETLALNFHDDNKICDDLELRAGGKESKDVKWKDVDSSLELYASHNEIAQQLAEKHNAHWS